jgi:acyl-[acyl-carrier-protein] desaturase
MTAADVRTNAVLTRELEPVAARELDRHISTAKEWFPHQYVPWSEGTDYDGEYDGLAWDETQSRIDKVGRTALVINLLTEDNLPSYHRAIIATTGVDDAWGEWVGRWTAEEARHAVAMRDYLTVTRAIDPVALERERMDHMTRGFASDVEAGLLTGMAYVSFQELATRISHRNTGRYTNDPGCDRLLARIAADENLHMLFYRNVMSAAFDVAPDDAMQAVLDVAEGFQMPGAEVEGFVRRSVQIAMAGIYDLRIHHDEVLSPVLRAWNVFERTDFGPTGEAARDRLAQFMAGLDAAATRFEDKRSARLDRIAQHA